MPSGLQFGTRSVALPEENVGIIADLHLGRDATSSVRLPLGEQDTLLAELEELFNRWNLRTLVVAGDILHAYDSIPEGVEETLEEVLDAAEDHNIAVRLLRGNHDNLIDEIDLGIPVRTTIQYGTTLICHGHERPPVPGDVEQIVLGHEHPMIEIEGDRHPCTLVGPAAERTEELIIIPPFNPLIPGSAVNARGDTDMLSPLVADVDAFCPVVVGETVHKFPPLGTLRRFL